jgi:hypothetical protein
VPVALVAEEMLLIELVVLVRVGKVMLVVLVVVTGLVAEEAVLAQLVRLV